MSKPIPDVRVGDADYHSIEIHRDDVDEFCRRWEAWKASEA